MELTSLATTMFCDKKLLWFEGPPCLREPEEQWPKPPTTSLHDKSESPQMEITIGKIHKGSFDGNIFLAWELVQRTNQ